MAKHKLQSQGGSEITASSIGPAGTYVYFLLKNDGTVLTSYGAGGTTLDIMLFNGWTALRETPLSSGGALLVLKR